MGTQGFRQFLFGDYRSAIEQVRFMGLQHGCHQHVRITPGVEGTASFVFNQTAIADYWLGITFICATAGLHMENVTGFFQRIRILDRKSVV